MVSIINGKRYDSDKAVLVAEWDNDLSFSDFRSCSESLFRTVKGAFFLIGEGGPMSVYAVSITGGARGGKTLKAFSANEAYDWLLATKNTEAIEKYFSDRIVDA